MQQLSYENARQFITDTLSSLIVHENNTASFTLPAEIPTVSDSKTKLTITMNAVYMVGSGVYETVKFLDWETEWKGGENYIADLKATEGELSNISLRIAFMTEIDTDKYQEFCADYVELIAPFTTEQPANVKPNTTFTQNEKQLTARYNTADNRHFNITMTLPDGIFADNFEKYFYPSSSDASLSAFNTIVLIGEDNTPIGSFHPMRYGATDSEALSVINPASEDFPMQIYSPIALSNIFDLRNALKSFKLSESSGSAISHPADRNGQIVMDNIFAYDLNSEPYFLYITLEPDALTNDQLEEIALSITFSAKE